ncbi:MAG: VWA domain-containing protein, partial [Heliobacteriaceae bacterium]|nr:VWA domain-containing protein [Heliobacteriaceae bacterium]
ILFILDFSQSMTEYLDGRRKVDLMLETVRSMLHKISPDTEIGLRVYGHRSGFSAMDACRASSLIMPIAKDNSVNVQGALLSVKPRGMTPITYSLKQAVKNDFMGFSGKKHIILLTDGGENCDESPCKYVMELVKIRPDVTIDVIAFNIRDRDDLEQLECTAMVTRGKFYTANTAVELARSLNNTVNVYKDVEARIIPNY